MNGADSVWRIDKTINLPSLIPMLIVAFTGIWWLSQLQSQVSQNSLEIASWKVTWAEFLVSHELVVRDYGGFKATQEQSAKDIVRRLDEIRQEQQRVSDALSKRDGRL